MLTAETTSGIIRTRCFYFSNVSWLCFELNNINIYVHIFFYENDNIARKKTKPFFAKYSKITANRIVYSHSASHKLSDPNDIRH